MRPKNQVDLMYLDLELNILALGLAYDVTRGTVNLLVIKGNIIDVKMIGANAHHRAWMIS